VRPAEADLAGVQRSWISTFQIGVGVDLIFFWGGYLNKS